MFRRVPDVSFFDDWESYFYPETYDADRGWGTLVNLFGERDPDRLREIEYRETAQREAELKAGAGHLPQTFDAKHLKAIHRYLFQDVYEWAGEYRTVNIAKHSSSFADFRGGIDSYLADAHRVATLTAWGQLDHDEFADTAARVFAYVNQAHPFREGNGRASKIFMHDLARRSHFKLVFGRISPDVWNQASEFSGPDLGMYQPHWQELVPVFRRAAVPRASGALKPAVEAVRAADIAGQQMGLGPAQMGTPGPSAGQQPGLPGSVRGTGLEPGAGL